MNTITPFTADDLDEICALEQACFSSPWSREILAAIIDSPHHHCFKLVCDANIAAYSVLEIEAAGKELPQWASIQNLAVASEFRRCGYGEILLAHMIELAQSLNVATIFLEVRTGNVAARALYEKHGFSAIGVRKDYYRFPTEDAIIMARSTKQGARSVSMVILAFETSCDETSVAVVEMSQEKRTVLANLVASQVTTHAQYGGVVPEIASRAHVEVISQLTYAALAKAKITIKDIDVVAVASHPGLIGALLVGVNFAKSLALSWDKPLVSVNHITGHIAAAMLTHTQLNPPFLALVVSGGHTSIIDVRTFADMETISRTRDDAMGEAFDKIGRLLGFDYPAGAALDKLAAAHNDQLVTLSATPALATANFPSAAIKDSLDFSFSGLKTAAINLIHKYDQRGEELPHAEFAAAFTNAAVGSIITRLQDIHAERNFKRLVVCGGVAANSHLRKALADFGETSNVEIFLPTLDLCGDNAAMIAAAAYYQAIIGDFAGTSLNARAGM